MVWWCDGVVVFSTLYNTTLRLNWVTKNQFLLGVGVVCQDPNENSWKKQVLKFLSNFYLEESLWCLQLNFYRDKLFGAPPEAVYTKMGRYVHSYGTLFNHWFGTVQKRWPASSFPSFRLNAGAVCLHRQTAPEFRSTDGTRVNTVPSLERNAGSVCLWYYCTTGKGTMCNVE